MNSGIAFSIRATGLTIGGDLCFTNAVHIRWRFVFDLPDLLTLLLEAFMVYVVDVFFGLANGTRTNWQSAAEKASSSLA